MIKSIYNSIKTMLFSKPMCSKMNCSLNSFVEHIIGIPAENYRVQILSSTSDTFEFKINKKLFLWINSFNPIIHCKAVDEGANVSLEICCEYQPVTKGFLFIISMGLMLLFVINLVCFGVSMFMVIFIAVYLCFVLSLNLHGYALAKRIITDYVFRNEEK